MSRVGKKPIEIPTGVDVTIAGFVITVKGPKGTLTFDHHPAVAVAREGETIMITVADEGAKKVAALWGLTRALVQNMVTGVTTGFSKTLEINGVGFKVASQGSALVFNVGFSHPVKFDVPKGIEAKVEKNVITVSGIDRQLVGQVAAEIRHIKPPEPYKGKGIKYTDEVIRRKVGKVIKSAA